jgi:hypothetical protein
LQKSFGQTANPFFVGAVVYNTLDLSNITSFSGGPPNQNTFSGLQFLTMVAQLAAAAAFITGLLALAGFANGNTEGIQMQPLWIFRNQ